MSATKIGKRASTHQEIASFQGYQQLLNASSFSTARG